MGIRQENVIIACNHKKGTGHCHFASFDSLFELGIFRCTKRFGDCKACKQLVLDKEKQRKKYEKQLSR